MPETALVLEFLTPVGFFLACIAAASTGAAWPPGTWYDQLSKPSWTPPNWLFPVAWTVLYILIAWAAWRVSALDHPAVAPGLALWAAQIALNATWSPMFFGKRRPGAAFLIIVGLWFSVAGTMICFFLADRIAGLMFVPYLIWGTYAGALNLSVWRRNPPEAWRAA